MNMNLTRYLPIIPQKYQLLMIAAFVMVENTGDLIASEPQNLRIGGVIMIKVAKGLNTIISQGSFNIIKYSFYVNN